MEIPSPCHEAQDQEAVRGLGADLVVGQGEPAEVASQTLNQGDTRCESCGAEGAFYLSSETLVPGEVNALSICI